MKRLLLAFALGVAASVYYDGAGDGFGDYDYRYWTFSWRGRRLELHIAENAHA